MPAASGCRPTPPGVSRWLSRVPAAAASRGLPAPSAPRHTAARAGAATWLCHGAAASQAPTLYAAAGASSTPASVDDAKVKARAGRRGARSGAVADRVRALHQLHASRACCPVHCAALPHPPSPTARPAPQELLAEVCGKPAAEAGEALADALVEGGKQAHVAAKAMLKEFCPDETDPCEHWLAATERGRAGPLWGRRCRAAAACTAALGAPRRFPRSAVVAASAQAG